MAAADVATAAPDQTKVQDAEPAEAEMDTKSHRVYVGNLAWKVQWQDLKDHMRQRGGNVIRADIFEDAQGRSRGCGLVEYETAEQARDAIEHLTDTELFDRKIFVREDREDIKPRRPSGSIPRGTTTTRGGYRKGPTFNTRRSEEYIKDCQVFVGNLAYKATWQDLKDLFNEDGHVVRADVYESNGRSRGCGTVLFREPSHAQRAIEKFNEYELMGRNIMVRLDTGPPAAAAAQRASYA